MIWKLQLYTDLSCFEKSLLWTKQEKPEKVYTLGEKCPNTESFISGQYFPVFSPNTGKCGLEITPYLETCHAVIFTGNWKEIQRNPR